MVVSCYSLDLRERVLAFVDEGQTYQDAVDTFKISYSCLRTLVRLRDETGTLDPRPAAWRRQSGPIST